MIIENNGIAKREYSKRVFKTIEEKAAVIDEQIENATKFIKTLEGRHATLDQKIAKYQERIKLLKNKRANLREYHRVSYHRVFQMIRDKGLTPEEILVRVDEWK